MYLVEYVEEFGRRGEENFYVFIRCRYESYYLVFFCVERRNLDLIDGFCVGFLVGEGREYDL